MVFPVVGGDGKPTGYEIENSLRFNPGDSPKLERTVGTPTNEKIYTISIWVKKGTVGDSNYILGTPPEGDRLSLGDNVEFITNGSANAYLRTNRKTRDVAAWYHIVIAYDTTQGTAANRVKLYINGEQYTWDLSTTYPAQDNTNGKLNKSGETFQIGTGHGGDYGNGYFSEFHFVDGQALTPTNFAETNDNGVWAPIEYTGTYGNNGFYMEFKQTGTSQNSSGIGADTSGNDNHFAVTNLTATDITVDTPTNSFATLNPLSNFEGSTLSEGNTKAVTPAGSQNGLVPATMGVQNGKWYWEVKVPTTNYVAVGIIADDKLDKAYLTGSNSSTRIVKGDDGTKHSSNSSGGSYMAAYEGSILQVALNLDDGEITFGAGGSWANGSGSTNQTFANSTAAYTDLNSSSDFTNKFILPVVSDENQGTSDTFEMNFGNAPFSISSGNSDGAGYGNFEYAVPSGYYALCTKNLAEYG